MGLIRLPDNSIQFFKKNLDEIFSSGNLAEGKWNRAVSEQVAEFCGCTHAVPTASNGSGIVAVLEVMQRYYGRTAVLIQSNTMYGVKTMAVTSGLRLGRAIDCSTTTLMPTIDDVRSALSGAGPGGELVLLLSHIGGVLNPDILEIAEECRRRDVLLVEDCAHSYAARLNGEHSGTFGDAGVFSFYATKAIPAGEGGAIVTSDPELARYLSKYVIYDRFDRQLDIGVNIRPSEVQALLIYSAIVEAEAIVSNKRGIADRYSVVCDDLDIPYISQESAGQAGNYYKFVVLGPVSALPKLKSKTSPVYDYALGRSSEICTSHSCLPIWYGQPDELTQQVIGELRSHFA